MNVYDNINSLTADAGNIALACGNFDGIHQGHQRVFAELVTFCKKQNLKPVIFSFDPHPRKVLLGDHTVQLLTSLDHKLQLFERYGINHTVIFPFSKEVAAMSPEYFVKNCLTNSSVKAVFAGQQWRFGHRGSGNIDTLKSLADGFSVQAIEELASVTEKISSSHIRQHLINGELQTAERFLGRRFSVLGTIVRGEQVAGRLLNCPTANLSSLNEVIPPNGIYAGFGKFDSKVYPGVINVGYSPTFHDESAPTKVEFHVFDFDDDLYGKEMEVEFVEFVRGEIKFDSVDELILEIQNDIARCRKILTNLETTMEQ